MPTVTVAFTARERFSMAAESLQCLLQNTRTPFRLIIVNGNVPFRYLKEMEQVLHGRANVDIISRPDFLLPNKSKQLALEASRDDYILFLENDCLIRDGGLDRLLAAAEEFPAPVAVPLLMEGRPGDDHVHHDRYFGRIETAPDGSIIFHPEEKKFKNLHADCDRELTRVFETHCFLVRRNIFDKIGPFDETLSMDEHTDLALQFYRNNIPVVREPRAVVNFIPPPPVNRDELPFYKFRWASGQVELSHNRVRKRWNIISKTGAAGFAHSQKWRTTHATWAIHRAYSWFEYKLMRLGSLLKK